MSTRLEARPIPAGIAMSRELYVAPLDFIRSLWRQDVHREGNFEHDMTLIPFNMGVEVQPRRVMIERYPLYEVAVQNTTLDLDGLTQFTIFHQLNRRGRLSQPDLIIIENIDIPGDRK